MINVGIVKSGATHITRIKGFLGDQVIAGRLNSNAILIYHHAFQLKQ
jgi:hypothetical protein